MNLATTTPRPTHFIALAGMALALALPAAWAQQPAQPPKLNKSYYERVDELQDRVNEGKLAEVAGTIVPTTERKTFEVDKLNDDQTWWQYEDDTTFIHIENSTGQTIAGVVGRVITHFTPAKACSAVQCKAS